MRTALAALPMPEGRDGGPHFSIAPTESGWLLVIQDEQCSVMQVFRTSTAAHHAIERMMAFFETMRTQAPASRPAF